MRRFLPPVAMCVAVLVGCSSSSPTRVSPPVSPAAAPFDRLLAEAPRQAWRGLGADTVEVWLCRVPADTTAALYGGLPLRLPISPAGVVSAVGAGVQHYFETVSHGRYRPTLVAGGEVTMQRADTPQACVDRAIAGAAATTGAVLAVADAEHAADQPGGLGSAGLGCPTAARCSVAVSRRWAYVGASDFAPEWRGATPLDLLEHELGHTLGWVHSAVDADGHYSSALDVMSDSAAPRSVDPARRDGPDTIALDRVLVGWLSSHDVVVARSDAETTAALSSSTVSSTGASGTRLMVLPLSSSSFLTVELLTADGFDADLPATGIAVHRVDVALHSAAVQQVDPLVGSAPFDRLVQVGDRWSDPTSNWRLEVGAHWTVVARRVESTS